MQAGHNNTDDWVKAFPETDFTEDLMKFDVPKLILHRDDDLTSRSTLLPWPQ